MPITCQQLTKCFRSTLVINALDWQLDEGSVWGVVGPSGAGKTTLLRLIAGLERPDAGTIEFRTVSGESVSRPRVGMVFQGLGLWPHLTVLQHLEYVLSRVGTVERKSRCRHLLEAMHLPERLWLQRPGQLSGGESQRLALARALAGEPQLLLLDEPFAQVDAVLHEELLDLLREQVMSRRLTTVFVTHSWSETARLAERSAVLVAGRFLQLGSCSDLLRHPANAQVARLTGPVVAVPRSLIESGYIAGDASFTEIVADGDSLLIRPQQIRLTAPTERNRWQVKSCEPQAAGWLARLLFGDHSLQIPVGGELSVNALVGLRIVGW